MTKTYSYVARIINNGKGYHVDFPDLNGCKAFGRNYDEAVVNARHNFLMYIERRIGLGSSLPERKFEPCNDDHSYLDIKVTLLDILIAQRERHSRAIIRH